MKSRADLKILEGTDLPAGCSFQKQQNTAAAHAATAPIALQMVLVALLLALLSLANGCATAPVAAKPPHGTITSPTEGMLLQRAVLTIHGREFSLNGYVVRSEAHGLRLIMTENFGGVLADVLVKPDGKVFVMQAKAPFRPEWIEKYLAADLKCIFGLGTEADCPVQMVSPTHFVVERRAYKLDLRTIEARPRPQPVELFDETSRSKP